MQEKWQVHKDALERAELGAYSRAVDTGFSGSGANPPPPALGKGADVLYEVDMMSEPDPAGPAQVDLHQVAARLEGYAELTTLQKIIREKLQTPALIEVTVGADLSDRKHRQIQRRRELAKHLGRTSVTECRMPNIAIDEETISVWISREKRGTFCLTKGTEEGRNGVATASRPGG